VQNYFSDPSQGFVDWSYPPTFDEDLVESYFPYDKKEEPVANWFTPIFYGIYPQEEKPFEEVNLLESFTTLDGISVSQMKTLIVKCLILMLMKCLIMLISLG
jgi:hypothetical protein